MILTKAPDKKQKTNFRFGFVSRCSGASGAAVKELRMWGLGCRGLGFYGFRGLRLVILRAWV